MRKSPHVFIVILNWNRSGDTLECLKSVERLSIVDYRLSIIVVDNGSSDNSVEILRKYDSKVGKYILIENKENLGFAVGNNVGIKYALKHGADYILIMNNDVLVHEKLVFHFLKAVKENSLIGAASPKIYFAPGFEFHKNRYKKTEAGRVIWYAGGEIDWRNVYGKTRGVDTLDKGQFEKQSETDFATGACMFLSKKALEEVGFFDEKYFMYYEDTDLSVRMKKKGWKVLYVPGSQVWHKVAQSSGIGSDLNDYFITRNRLIFGSNYAPLRTKVALIRESIKLLLKGRVWQKVAVKDFYLGNLGKGSWK